MKLFFNRISKSSYDVKSTLALIALLFVLFFFTGCCPKPVSPNDESSTAVAEKPHTLGHEIALFLPNRIFDLLDIFRIRLRVGPGVSVGVRATKYAQVYLGSYFALYAGLPGPRSERSLPLPLGLETLNGLRLSVLDATANTCFDPRYTDSEIGISATVLLLGFDLGLDPVEIWDFLEGFFGGDFRKDDL